jgi:Tfp pilus assembly protein PilF
MKYFLFLMLFLQSWVCNAQIQGQPLIDSLLGDLPNAKVDSVRLKLLYELGTAYKTIDPNKGIKYGLEALELAKTIKKPYSVGNAYNILGLNYYYKSNYTLALEYFNKALVIFADRPESGPYGSIISHIAVIYQEIGNYEKSLEFNKRSLELDIKNEDTVNIGGDYGNLGIIYLLQKNYEKALEYDFKSLEIFTEINDKDGIAHNYGNIGNVYSAIKDYERALEFDNKAYDLFKELGDNNGMAINLGNIGAIYVTIAKEMDSLASPNGKRPKGTRSSFVAKGIHYLRACVSLSKQIGQLDNLIEYNKGLYEAYMITGNLDSALASFKQYTMYRDSVYSAENKLKIAVLETEREIAIRDKQIQIEKLEVMQKRNEKIILIILLILLVIVVGVIFRQFKVQTKRNKQLSKEKTSHLARIEEQKMVMGDIAHTQSHDVSGKVATILGLAEVFNKENYADPDNKVVIDGIVETAEQLDVIVKEMIVMENNLNRKNPPKT